MKTNTHAAMESLEVRQLLAQIGPDISFADGGISNTQGGLLLKSLPNDETLSISPLGSFAITKLQADGTPDPAFGNHGLIAIGGRFSLSTAAVTQNHIFIIGSSKDHPGNQLLAFNITNGAFDKNFGGGDGKESVPLKQPGGGLTITSGSESLNPTPDGGVLITAGLTLSNNQIQNQFIKLRPDGSVDTSFGAQGYIQVTGVGGTPAIWTASGIVFATQDENGNTKLFRYRTTGLADTTFGTQGVVNVGSMFGPQLLEEPNGQLLVVGEDSDASEATLVKRFNVNGLADLSFGTNGTATLVDHDSQTHPQQLAVDPNSRILVLSDQTISRLTSGGKLDTAFNDTGTFSLSTVHAAFDALNVTADSMSRVVFSGSSTVTRLDVATSVKLGANGILFIAGTSAADTINVSLSSSTIHAVLNGHDSTFTNASVLGFNINAGDGDNQVVLTVAKNATITSGAGKDTILTAGGDDSISSGDGDDSIASGGGNDTVKTGAGNSEISGGTGDDFLTAGNGNCTIFTGFGNDKVVDGDGDSQIFGSAEGFKNIAFGAGATTVNVGRGGSNINNFGATGNSGVTIGGGNNTVDLEGPGNHTIFSFNGGKNTISTGIGSNNITITGDSDNTINTKGNDHITGGAGNDFILGVNSGLARTLVVNSGAGNDTIATGDAAADINAGSGNDLIKTGNQNDTILGGSGNDTVHAAGGNDYISGGGGKDRIFGQDGDDTIIGGTGNDVLFAGAGTNTLSGQGGNDTLVGSASDVLSGGAGTDQILIS